MMKFKDFNLESSIADSANRKTLSVQVPESECRQLGPSNLLAANFRNPLRFGKRLTGELRLEADLSKIPDVTTENLYQEYFRRTIDYPPVPFGIKHQDEIGSPDETSHQALAGEIKTIIESERDLSVDASLLKLCHGIFDDTVTIWYQKPLFFFDREGTNLKQSPTPAPEFYALYVNTRIHFGSLFYDYQRGWGASVTFLLSMLPRLNYARKFIRLLNQLERTVWPNIRTLYNERIAGEFLARNCFKPVIFN